MAGSSRSASYSLGPTCLVVALGTLGNALEVLTACGTTWGMHLLDLGPFLVAMALHFESWTTLSGLGIGISGPCGVRLSNIEFTVVVWAKLCLRPPKKLALLNKSKLLRLVIGTLDQGTLKRKGFDFQGLRGP